MEQDLVKQLFSNRAELSLALELNSAFDTILLYQNTTSNIRSKRDAQQNSPPAISQAVFQVS